MQAQETASPPRWAHNANLGRFTNFVNLLDMCGCAVPSTLLQLDAEAAAKEVGGRGVCHARCRG